MATLTGSTIASTYKQLLKVTSEGIGADASAKYIEDGLGTDSALSISTTRVGIGTDSPTYDVDVLKSVSGGTVALRVANSNTGANSAAMLYLGAFGASGTGDPYIYFNDDSNDWAIGSDKSDSSKFKISDSSSVGTNDRLVIDTSGNIGVGVTNPGSAAGSNALDIRDTNTSSATQGASLRLGSNDGAVMGAGHRMGVIEFAGAEDGGGTMVGGARIDALAVDAFTATGTYDHNSKLQFSVQDGTDGTDKLATPAMTILGSGYVGIGVTAPTQNLHVEGVILAHKDVGDAGVYIDSATNSDAKLKLYNGGSESWNIYSDGSATNDPLIFYDTAGTAGARLILDANSRISLSNNDSGGTGGLDSSSGNTIFGYQAGADVASGGINNSFFGHGAGKEITTGDYNTAVGGAALAASLDGDDNTAIGFETLAFYEGTDNAGDNTAVGSVALRACTTGGTNTAIGSRALTAITTGAENVSIGFQSAQAFGVGETGNIAIGANSMNSMDEGTSGNVNYNVAIGLESFLGGNINTSSTDVIGNIAIGAYALDATSTNAHTGTIAIGHNSLTALTSGSHNTAIGYNSMSKLTTGAENVAIGKLAMEDADGTESYNVAIGFHAMGDVDHDDSDANVAIGGSALAGGDAAVKNCVAIGYNALDHTAGNAQDGTVAIGKSALTALTEGERNIAIGYNAGLGLVDSDDCTFIGYQAGEDVDSLGSAPMGCTYIGSYSGKYLDDGTHNTALGFNAMIGTTGGASCNLNVGIGKDALKAITTGDNNTIIGALAGDSITTSSNNTALGYNALTACGSSYSNVAVGTDAGDTITDSGAFNICIGTGSDVSTGTAENQIAIGYAAIGQANNSVTLGNENVTAVYMGSDSGARVYCETLNASKAGLCNMNLTSYSTSAGEGATIYLNRSNHGTLGTKAAVDANDVIGQIIFQGSDANTLEAGAYIHVQAAETWDEDSRGTQMTFQCVPSGANSTTITNRLHIAGDGTLTASSSNDISDEELKENIKDVENGLDTIKKLQGRTFTWKESAYMPSGTKYGLIAQELEKILPDLVHDKSGIREKEDGSYYKSIQMSGVIPVLIEAVKELSAKVEALEAK